MLSGLGSNLCPLGSPGEYGGLAWVINSPVFDGNPKTSKSTSHIGDTARSVERFINRRRIILEHFPLGRRRASLAFSPTVCLGLPPLCFFPPPTLPLVAFLLDQTACITLRDSRVRRGRRPHYKRGTLRPGVLPGRTTALVFLFLLQCGRPPRRPCYRSSQHRGYPAVRPSPTSQQGGPTSNLAGREGDARPCLSAPEHAQ